MASPFETPRFSQFITICTHEYRNFLGLIRLQRHHKIWCPSPWGQAVEKTLRSMQQDEAAVVLEDYVVMPNHLHLLVLFHTCDRRLSHNFIATCKQGLARAMRAASPTEEPLWEKSFFQHTIQSTQSHYALSQSIRSHHDHWMYDSLYRPVLAANVAEPPAPWYP